MLYWFSWLQCKLLQLHVYMTLLYSYSLHMSQYNKLSDYRYVRFHILAVHLHFALFWSGGIFSRIPGQLVSPMCVLATYDFLMEI